MNLRITFYLILIAILILLFDYLRRANIYGKSSFPLPLPSSWLNALTRVAPLVISKKKCRKSAGAELARLVMRGDSFLYLTDDHARASKLPSSMRRFPVVGGREDIIPVTEEVDDDFVFEALWYGRSSFVVDSAARAQQVLDYFVEKLTERKASRANVSQTAHIVWDLEVSMPTQIREAAAKVAEATGFSILLLGDATQKRAKTTHSIPEGDLLTS